MDVYIVTIQNVLDGKDKENAVFLYIYIKFSINVRMF